MTRRRHHAVVGVRRQTDVERRHVTLSVVAASQRRRRRRLCKSLIDTWHSTRCHRGRWPSFSWRRTWQHSSAAYNSSQVQSQLLAIQLRILTKRKKYIRYGMDGQTEQGENIMSRPARSRLRIACMRRIKSCLNGDPSELRY